MKKLRDDNRIRTIVKATEHNEPKRIETAQALKAVGSSSGVSRSSLDFI